MKKLGIVLSVVAALGLLMGTAGEAFAKKKAAPKPKKLWEGWVEEVKKAKWTWKAAPAKKAPAKGKKK
jgi:hypothetical protein